MRFESGRSRDLKAETWCGRPIRIKCELPEPIRRRLARDYLIYVLATRDRWSTTQIALALDCSRQHVRSRLKAAKAVLAEASDAS